MSESRYLLVGLMWFIGGALVGGATALMCVMVGMGGMQTPPAIWGVALVYGIFVLPLQLAFTGVPVAVLVKRGKPATRAAMMLAAFDLFCVVLVWGTVIGFRPKY